MRRGEPERPPGRVISLNSGATTRNLTIAFTDFSYPGFSPDGKWISFAAPDSRNKWNVYTVGESGGEPRKLTTESSTEIFTTDISPDGSMILYDRWNPYSRESEVRSVPASGGAGIRIAEPGMAPRWRPDGRRIGYLVRTTAPGGAPGRLEFRSARPDGNDPRIDLEEPDFSTSIRPAFSWSPDGKSVALIRTLSSGNQELFIHGFESGVETQLTFDEAHIGDVCWAKDNDVLYSSSKDGHSNIWIVPAEGGTPVKVSNGAGPDVSMSTPDDASTLLILRHLQEGLISVADSNAVVVGQIPLSGLDMRSASVSPDGATVAVQALEADPLKPVSHIYVAARSGGDLRTLSPGGDIAGEPRWSPDGKWIAYCAHSISEPLDSERAYVVGTASGAAPRSLGIASDVWWLDSATVILHGGMSSWKVGVTGGERSRYYKDSTYVIPMSDGVTVFLRDLRPGREGWWVDSLPPPPPVLHSDSTRPIGERPPSSGDSAMRAADSSARLAHATEPPHDTLLHRPDSRSDSAGQASNDSSGTKRAVRISAPRFLLEASRQFALCSADRYILYRNETGEIWKKSLADGSETRLAGKFPDLGVYMSVTPGGREILFVESQRSSQLRLMEHLR